VSKSCSRRIEKIAYVVPCYNEEDCLCEFYRRVSVVADRHADLQFSFVFVNDGSGDHTAEILDELAERDPRVEVLHLAWNSGHQKALCAGLDYAEGDLVIILDGDLQDPPELFDEILAKVQDGYEIVHMQRRTRAGVSGFHLFVVAAFYWLIRRFGSRKMVPECGDFRGITRPVLQAIRYYREPHKYYRGLFATMGFRQTVVSYDRDTRYAGDSKYPFRKLLAFALDAILSFSTLPLRLVIAAACVTWGISLIYLVCLMIEVFCFGRGTGEWLSIMASMAAFTALILSCLSMMGAYIRRIFEQGQNRPQYYVYTAKNVNLQDLAEERRHIRECRLSARGHRS
jgi:dolichol-phosphate mannosyltransferase